MGTALGFEVVKGTCSTALVPMTGKERHQRDAALATQAIRFHAQLGRSRAARSRPASNSSCSEWDATACRSNSPRQTPTTSIYAARGWFEADYFYPARLSLAKRSVGRLADAYFAQVEDRLQGRPEGSQRQPARRLRAIPRPLCPGRLPPAAWAFLPACWSVAVGPPMAAGARRPTRVVGRASILEEVPTMTRLRRVGAVMGVASLVAAAASAQGRPDSTGTWTAHVAAPAGSNHQAVLQAVRRR